MRKFSSNNKGQMQLLEVILVAGMLLVALYFVRGVDISAQTSVENENKLDELGDTILESLAAKPSPYSYYNSLLALYISSSSYYSIFENYVSTVLPEGTIFKIDKIDMTEFTHNPTASLDDVTTNIYTPDIWLGEEARVSRLVLVGDTVYKVVLSMWINVG